MSWMSQLAGMLQQYANGEPAPTVAEAHAHYDQIAAAVPSHEIASAIGPALSTLGTPALQTAVATSAATMSPDQRQSFVQTLLSGLGPGAATVLSQLGIGTDVAQNPAQASPADVGALATHVQQTHPEVFDRAMAFYSQHPTLVKTLGVLALARIAQQLTQR